MFHTSSFLDVKYLSFNINAYMTFLRTLIVSVLLIEGSWVYADGSVSTLPFGLINASQEHSQEHILEFWGYHDYLGSENYSDTLKLRYYNPLNIGDWHGTARLDTAYTSNYGPQQANQSTGTYTPSYAMFTVWGGLPSWLGNAGARVIAPLQTPGQWAVGPQLSTSFRPKNSDSSLLSDFSPLTRYMYGFDSKAAPGSTPPALVRRLELYPTIGINLSPSTQIRFWDENGINYNSAGGGWFVPIDAMVTHRVNQNFLFAVGFAKQVVQTYQQYDWSLYSKLSFNF
ncbi:hypothetical protein [Polynucleobacter sp. MWH-Creno-3A4]|uniref:hypothetical protein n=1 Tax=Polynucleobacter sp. MWH-Creno-3A4 TaxID=1855886 RepID=UPI0021066381|nr:hypothetical protein [Polynucleobacter sp. MWH-Creno-3A4]